MILPKALALSVQLIMLVATVDRTPQLDVEPVCKGIAEQGGVTFRDPAVAQEKRNCIESELAVREQLAKQWSSFSADGRTRAGHKTMVELPAGRPHALRERNDNGRLVELHGVAHLSGNGARCASHEG